MTRDYAFHSTWRIDAPPDAVYTALADVETYSTWWPQVRRATRLDGDSGELVCRSVLPYDLTFVMHREIEDPARHVLRARMTGDLVGTSQWAITADGAGSIATFDEDVTVGRGLIRTVGRLMRPALRMNHDAMMRAGEKGLRAHLRDHLAGT